MKKYFVALALVLALFILPIKSSAQTKVHLDLFFSPTCPHCQAEEAYLSDLQTKYPQLEVSKYDVNESVNQDLIVTFYNKYNVTSDQWGLVPANFVNDKFFIGFDSQIQDYLTAQLTGSPNVTTTTASSTSPTSMTVNKPLNINVPFLGRINIAGINSLFLAIILGFLDGLNPCALTALGFLLALAAATGDRKKIFWIGGTFVVTSGLVLFVFINAWLKAFDFLSQVKFLTVIVGVLCLIFAVIILNEYLKNIFCKLCDENGDKKMIVRWQRKLFGFLTELSQMDKSLPIILLGVAAVSVALNLIQLFCSIGLPLAFAKVLDSQHLTYWLKLPYLLVYVVFYVLNQAILFLIALFTLKATHIEGKYFKYLKLASGIVLLALGIIMIIRGF